MSLGLCPTKLPVTWEVYDTVAVQLQQLLSVQQQLPSVKHHVGLQHPALTHFACLDLFSLPKSISLCVCVCVSVSLCVCVCACVSVNFPSTWE